MKTYIYHSGEKNYTFQLNLKGIRYRNRNTWHPYGVKTSFDLTFINPAGKKMRKFFSDIGTDQRAAFANALRMLSVYLD